MTKHKTFICEDLSTPIGPYSHGSILVEESKTTLYSSGQIGITKDGNFLGNDIKSQTEQTLSNLKTLLESKNLSLDNVVKTTCYLTTMEHFAEFNEVYAKYFDSNKPARTTIAVSGLPKNALVEIELIAIG